LDGRVRDVVIEVREPYARAALVHFLTLACVPGVETVMGGVYTRTLRLDHGPARVEVRPLLSESGSVRCGYDGHPADLAAATARLAALVDAGHDPEPADAALAGHPLLTRLVRATPGLRVHRDADVFEVAVRTVIGQQVSVAGARTLTSRMVTAVGTPADLGDGLTHLFPTPEQVAATAPEDFAMPRSRGRALVGLARAVAGGDVDLGAPGVRARLLALPGIGPWSVDHVAMRSLGDPDVFLPTDIGVRRAAERLGTDLPGVVAASEAWRPWRSYALTHLWQVATTVGAPA
jgi:AraC family transcriptional regulator of adaptative response / DNA-3-methyladenine glycosylase II